MLTLDTLQAAVRSALSGLGGAPSLGGTRVAPRVVGVAVNDLPFTVLSPVDVRDRHRYGSTGRPAMEPLKRSKPSV
jgi:hypothetical protein